MLTFTATDVRGEPVTGRYFERYWLPIVGPTGTVLMRHLGEALERTDPYQLPGHELAALVGLGDGTRRLSMTLDRLVDLALLEVAGEKAWRVRTSVTPLTPRQVDRLPAALGAQHRELTRMLASI